ncbi:hypothetical protein BBJ28_00010788 [Nothophytophthora sp. Chile5]|nr:hypothetical protein BBJ28_00010788 [Nothophytophthora sp. Chile5]
MNSVVSPLRMNMTTTPMHHQHPTASRSGHRSRASSAAAPSPSHDDVMARAHAIALAQAQIQAQVQGYAQRSAKPQPQSTRHPASSSSSSSTRHRPHRTATTTTSRADPAAASSRPHRSQHRSQRQPEAEQPQLQRSHSSSKKTPATHGNCRSSRATSSAGSRAASSASSRSSSRSAAASTAAPAPTPAPAPAPVAWRVAVDPKSKRPYYYHPITRATTWTKPAELLAAETREKRRFFSAMEHNIRSKLRDGRWLRVSGDERVSEPLPLAAEASPTSRSSASTASCGSARSSGGSGLAASAKALLTRSLPTTPEGLLHQPQQEPEISDDDENKATKRPQLFRTLSSYETPVMRSSRKETGSDDRVPSPIQERVRLARASDLDAYMRQAATAGRASLQVATIMGGGSASALLGASAAVTATGAKSDLPVAQPRRRRANSTNSIYLRMGTMNAPDQDATIQCVATVLRAHMMEALAAPRTRDDPRFHVFLTTPDHQSLAAIADDEADPTTRGSLGQPKPDAPLSVPSLADIGSFIKHVFARAQMESECIIMSLVYVERLLKATSGALTLRAENWRRLLFCSMVMASKVWDDLSMSNADFSKIWPELALKEMNELELAYLSAVEYNVRVSAASYAKYYFHLRSLCAGMGMLQAFDESAPLNLDGARKMQVLSEEYQERSKLLPAPRRRSVTITTTSAMEPLQIGAASATAGAAGATGAAATGAAKHSKPTAKASPAASLEQLVHMQVRGAGGSALSSSMHRLSSSTVK